MLWLPTAFFTLFYKQLLRTFTFLYWLLNTFDFVSSRPKLIVRTVQGISKRGGKGGGPAFEKQRKVEFLWIGKLPVGPKGIRGF